MSSDTSVVERVEGVVVKLDRGFPLVQLSDGELIRCEHSTSLVKGDEVRAAIGDRIVAELPASHDKGIICTVRPRKTLFVRRDPAERTAKQVLAANFDTVIVVEPAAQLSRRRLERELVLAHETGARVVIVLSKTDLMSPQEMLTIHDEVQELAGATVEVICASRADASSIERIRALVPEGSIAILIGKSGVGKSTLVNKLAGEDVQDTAGVRESDGKGRHTTVDRVMISLPEGGCIVDMPGIRGLGVWEADQGLAVAFADIEELARSCQFRDCTHTAEPGCAVLNAVSEGALAQARLDSYLVLSAEIAEVRERREQARQRRGEKTSHRKKHHGNF